MSCRRKNRSHGASARLLGGGGGGEGGWQKAQPQRGLNNWKRVFGVTIVWLQREHKECKL